MGTYSEELICPQCGEKHLAQGALPLDYSRCQLCQKPDLFKSVMSEDMYQKRVNENEIRRSIAEQVKKYKSQSDYRNRGDLKAFGISLCRFTKQFYEPGTEKYNFYYGKFYDELSKIYTKAIQGVKRFDVYVDYKSKTGKEVFGYESSEEERSKEEVMKRLKEKEWRNLNTGRKIKPIFVNINITECLGSK